MTFYFMQTWEENVQAIVKKMIGEGVMPEVAATSGHQNKSLEPRRPTETDPMAEAMKTWYYAYTQYNN